MAQVLKIAARFCRGLIVMKPVEIPEDPEKERKLLISNCYAKRTRTHVAIVLSWFLKGGGDENVESKKLHGAKATLVLIGRSHEAV